MLRNIKLNYAESTGITLTEKDLDSTLYSADTNHDGVIGESLSSTLFTCFTSTKVQILTTDVLRARPRLGRQDLTYADV